jgi:hypothetical protein
VGVALSALTFILVSRATPPTPDENLRIFFDVPGSPEGLRYRNNDAGRP